jgi:hypothetical protein
MPMQTMYEYSISFCCGHSTVNSIISLPFKVSYAEGAAISKYMSAFVECSVKTGENLRAVFREAVRVALDKPKVTLIKCSLL